MAMFSIDPKDDIKSMIYEGNTLKLIPGEDFDLNWLASLPKEQNSRSISFIGKTHSGKENFQTLILVNLIFLISDSISKKKLGKSRLIRELFGGFFEKKNIYDNTIFSLKNRKNLSNWSRERNNEIYNKWYSLVWEQ